MKRYAAKVTGNGKTSFHETLGQAYEWAMWNGGGTVWVARSKTRGGSWRRVCNIECVA